MEYYEDGKHHEYKGHATELWTQKSLDYVHKCAHDHADDEDPFFMYVSYNGPYSTFQPLEAELNGENKSPFWPRFEHKEMESMPREPVAKEAFNFALTLIREYGPEYGAHEVIRSINNLPRFRNLFSQISYQGHSVKND